MSFVATFNELPASKFQDAVILGDLNADCSYIAKRKWPNVKLRNQTRFHWKIADSVDTTVSTTDCAYDR